MDYSVFWYFVFNMTSIEADWNLDLAGMIDKICFEMKKKKKRIVWIPLSLFLDPIA